MFLNVSDHPVTLKAGQEVAEIQEIEIVDEDKDTPSCGRVGKSPRNTPDQLPAHVQELYKNSKDGLSVREQEHLCSLLMEFSEVFAKDDFDLGNFSEIEHCIENIELPKYSKLQKSSLFNRICFRLVVVDETHRRV